jgi:hypothetical protein
MADLIAMLSAVAGQQGEEVDEDFNQTVLLLHGDGTNGAQNNTFLDGSTNNFTITRNGNTTQGTFSPFSLAAGEWSNYFDGTGDFLTTPSNSAFDFGTGSFTVEFWAYKASSTNLMALIGTRTGDASSTILWSMFVDTNGYLATQIYDTSNNQIASFSHQTLFTNNSWNHCALVRNGNTFYLYYNGVQSTSSATSSNAVANGSLIVRIGDFSTFNDMNGYLSNVRIVKGTAVYTSNFTPSTTPLTAITNTSLLTCQSNRFVDNSTNAFAITRNGDVRVTPFSPFAPSAAYSTSTNGGSGYFDGTGDYLTAPDDNAWSFAGDFTVEAWAYPISFAAERCVIAHWFGGSNAATSLNINFASSTGNVVAIIAIGSTQYTLTSASAYPAGCWHHIALVRSGSTVTLYVNGASAATTTASGTTNNLAHPLSIGALNALGSYIVPFLGYIAGVRILNGSAQVPPAGGPTSPPTAITNTSLLCNFTNAGIFDNTGKNNLETVGNAQIDTTTKKYGTGSMEFDGTGDWLLMPNTPDQQLGTGNFTIEFWVYLATGDTGSARGLVAKGTSTTGFLVSLDSSQKVVFTFTTSTITSSGAITTNAWNHIAVVREGTGSNQTKIYISGTNDGTGTVSTDFNQTSVMYVGANRTGGDPMKGFIDDLRITKGVARYTANFTAPTKAFPDQ